MELADPRMLAELIAAHVRMSGGRSSHRKQAPVQARMTMTASPTQQSSPKSKRCHCALCPRCREEARWERIFKERFADPDYYKERPARFGSSMGWLAGGGAAT
jgi:hypothetical protein